MLRIFYLSLADLIHFMESTLGLFGFDQAPLDLLAPIVQQLQKRLIDKHPQDDQEQSKIDRLTEQE